MSSEALKVFDITYIQYTSGDILSLLISVCSLIPIFVVACHASKIILIRRELFSITMFVGSLLCVAFNELLKTIIKEPRPEGSYKDGYGMPSNHTQLTFYYITVIALALAFRNAFQHHLWKTIANVTNLTSGILVGVSRCHAGVHSIQQVVFGAIFGFLFGSFWFVLSHKILSHSFPIIEQLPISKYLYVFDGSDVPNKMLFEYLAYQKKNNKRKAL